MPLARALYATVEIDDEIPVEHYHAVAEIIGYVMGLKRGISGDGPDERITNVGLRKCRVIIK